MKINVIESKIRKSVRSPIYNYDFNKVTGHFVRWGQTMADEHDPKFAPGPEILDIEISAGKCSGACKFCYKGNNPNLEAHNMTLEQFKTILDKMPRVLTQVAFGICDIDTNPDFFAMMDYCREKGIIPNYTCNGFKVTDEIAQRTADTCGAVAVSIYNKEASYNTIKKFTDAGMEQVNIHFMLSDETYDKAFEIVTDMVNDSRLEKMNAIVFLAYKPKGLNKGLFHTVKDSEKYKKLIKYCDDMGVAYGMDSCSAGTYIETIQDNPNKQRMSQFVESCESSLFSGYINWEGKYYHCSFSEGEGAWKDGIDVLNCTSFTDDVWNNKLTKRFREASILSASKNPYKDCGDCRVCLIFPEINPW